MAPCIPPLKATYAYVYIYAYIYVYTPAAIAVRGTVLQPYSYMYTWSYKQTHIYIYIYLHIGTCIHLSVYTPAAAAVYPSSILSHICISVHIHEFFNISHLFHFIHFLVKTHI